jgi:Ca2+-binding RTX toxin-like protein
MVAFIRSDLEFILEQIIIAERQAAGESLLDILPNVQVPFGLRTVDGSLNNLVPGNETFGVADNLFPRLADPFFRPAEAGTSYADPGMVIDSQPRIISNLIVDQTANNPAAYATAFDPGPDLLLHTADDVLKPGVEIHTSAGPDHLFGTADDTEVFFFPNVSPDVGLSAPFDPWFTFFGQFFDHGLDLVTKGGNEIVFVPLQPDDPLFVTGSPTNFMVLTRATVFPGPGADGIIGTGDDTVEHQNTTSPFVDQNQTYTSHPSHQAFLRAYELNAAGDPVATGKLIENRNLGADGQFGTADDTPIGGMATWAVVKAQARDILGINLTDADFDNVPLLATDAYGNFIPGPNGFPQVVFPGNVLVEGDPTANSGNGISLVGAVRTGHQFLIDIAHSALPVDDLGNPLLPDADNVINAANSPPAPGFYDNELLDAHYIAGDGRVNENIGLTAVHSIFHSEHNRLVDHTKSVLLADAAQLLANGATQAEAVAFLNDWLVVDVTTVPASAAGLQWDGERLFQAAKFGTEMQYQHLVFEEFARTMQPNVDAFLAPLGYDTTIDPSILAEFAHAVFRLGHSMLVESIDRADPNFLHSDIGLITAFLNPLAFATSGPTPTEATGAIVRGLTRQVGNEIDEFVTEAVRNNLLGLPLDLAVLNIARGRDTGLPSLNGARAQFYAMTGDSQLTPYISWVDFAMHLKHIESLVNFIAAYGTHDTITGAITLDAKRAAAAAIVFGGAGAPADRLDFLNATGIYAGGTLGGLNNVDLWVGGLAEEIMPFGGMLGSTFNFVFETQLESLQDGDRFYYLARTAGMNFLTELENNAFSKLVMLNTDVTHLPDQIFKVATWTLEVDPTKQFTGLGVDGRDDPTGGIFIGNVEITPLVIRDNPNTIGPDTNYLQYTGEDHIVLGGTPGDDILISSIGDDTLYGDEGNDTLDGGFGNDVLLGGAGDDIITDMGGDDNLQGGDGNDVIQAGNSTAAGVNLILGGSGNDFIITTEDISEIFAGQGNDFILGAKVNEQEMGGDGDDWIEKGTQDGAPGDNFNPRLADDVAGNDVFLGGGGFDEFIGEGGDDIFVGSDAQDKMDGMSGFDWVTYKGDRFGVVADLELAALGGIGEVADHIALGIQASPNSILDRFAEVEGLSGSDHTDILRGDSVDAATIINHGGATGGALTNLTLINGLQALLTEAGISTALPAPPAGFVPGNIILGGAGSDIVEGRGGDDLIDGDKWLNVRISVRAGIDPSTGLATGPEIASFDSMEDMIPQMLDGTYNPGQLMIVREILSIDPNSPDNFDTAVFSGNLSEYAIIRDDRGTPLNFSDDIVTVVDADPARDGRDTLTHIERLQFADQSLVLVPGRNAEPVGELVILDAQTNTPDNTPTEGQLLKVSIAGVTDGDNVSPTNPTGTVTGSVVYTWQAEFNAGTGVFEDIVDLRGDLAFQSANGTVFRVTPDLAGLLLRVKAVYIDAHGVAETVFSPATNPVIDVPDAPVAAPAPLVPEITEGGPGVHLIRSDLDFILDQIRVAERQAAGEDILSLVPNVRAPVGLRTVDGSLNNLINFGGVDQSEFGAADNAFPRLLDPAFRNADAGTSYANPGDVIDAQPRIISNLVVDQTAANPAAYATAYDPGLDGVLNFGAPGNDDVLKDGVQIVKSAGPDHVFGTPDDTDVFFFPNVAPDAGLSAPFNPWFTFFGQFFDHGLDLVTKGGNGFVFIPLLPDDPLFVPGSPTNFMVLTRATVLAGPGADGILGTADDTIEHENTTSPFVDQNQTYTSHPSHQVFLRAYEFNAAGEPVATGKLITNRDIGPDGEFGTADDVEIGGMSTWAVVKAQARDLLGIELTDADVGNVPLLATDLYGNFIKGPNGFPQVVMKGLDGLAGTADDVLVEGDPTANGGLGISIVDAVRTGHQFLIDIAHTASPFDDFGNPLTADADADIGNTPAPGFYDDELLDAHYMAGDGRVNENIGLTAVHSIFHAEHNRLVDQTKDTVLASNDLAFLNEWLLTPVASFPTPAEFDALQWNGERLFQAAKFGTEMQYQHLVFEEFARTMQPLIDPFFAPTQVYDTEIDASIVAEFAHTVFRLGHSMLTETIDRFDPNFASSEIGLITAFLNPLAFADSGPTPEEATGAIVRGLTRQVGNEIDEFVTEAVRNNLLGLPLDLPVLNLARGRDTGIPSLNAARAQFYEDTGDSLLKPYISWVDLVQHLKHPESVINFIAAYGTHPLITGATTLADKRAAADLLVFGGPGEPPDRLDFLNSTGAWASNLPVDPLHPKDLDGVTTTGLGSIDFWVGGLAEQQMPFGGLLGSTFNFVFENQLEKLQDGDRFYYLERTAGLNFNTELENNSFAKLIMANTDATHLPGLVFKAPAFTFEVDPTKQHTGLDEPGPDGIQGTLDDVVGADGIAGNSDPASDNPLIPLVIRDNPNTVGADSNYLRYTGEDHVVLGGTAGNDIIISSEGDDTIWGDAGNDMLEGGYGNDMLRGGAGNDIITDIGGDDNIQGGDGNDVVQGGNGLNLILGGFGSDFIINGEDSNESFGGAGNDFILGTKADEQNMGNEGDDWLEAGTSDGAPGDNFDPLGLDPIAGNDVYIGRGENDKFNAEGGDDIMVGSTGAGDRYIGASGYDWATFKDDAFGVTVDLIDRFFDQPPQPGSGASVLARFDGVEGLSGSRFGDVIRGDDEDATTLPTVGARGSVLTNIALIDGLQALLNDALGTPTTPVVTFFDGGNIILGGDGSDIIEGRGGNDLIDGDAWLNVRISVHQNADGTGPEIATFDSMVDLVPHMVSGEWNPGQLRIVREILTATGPDFDTAEFSGNLADYTVTINNRGTASTLDDIVTVTDNVGTDGTDTLKHIERLQFADQAVIVVPGLNAGPAGLLTLSAAPTEDSPVTVSIASVTDANNVSAANPTGAITGPVSYFWQSDGGTGVFADITTFGAGEAERAHGLTFTPGDDEVGTLLRVRAVYKDANGVLEEVFSAPQLVANVNDAPTGAPTISDSTPTQGFALTVDPTTIIDLDGTTAAVFTFQWQQANPATPTTWSNIPLATGQLFTPGAAQVGQLLRVVVSYIDDGGTPESVPSAATDVVGNRFIGTNAANTFTGNAGEDQLFGNGGADVLSGLAGNDLIAGGAGNDTLSGGDGNDSITGDEGNDNINGGAGNDIIAGGLGNDVINAGSGDDTINFTFGDGNDTVIGDLGSDVLNITGTTASNTLNVTFNGSVLTGIGSGTLSGIETVNANLLDGLDGLTYNGGTAAAVTVNLASHSASGFASITGIENVTGGSGADTLIGDGLANALTGGGGNDTLIGGLGNDTLTGAGGNDTVSYFGETDDMVISLADGTAQRAAVFEDALVTIENVIGGSGNDNITGTTVANRLEGGAGDDMVVGGAGSDTLLGQAGNDTFRYTTGDGNDALVDGGAGDDTLSILGTTAANTLNVVYNGTAITSIAGTVASLLNVEHVTADLLGGTDVLSYGTTSAGVSVDLGAHTASGFSAISNIENVTGGAGNDTLSGDGLANTLGGGAGNDTLTGGAGNDTLTGDAGNDTFVATVGDGNDSITGGAGNDTLDLHLTNAGATITTTLATSAEIGIDTLNGIENVIGSQGNDSIALNGSANVIDAQGGNDIIDAGGANDTIIGGTGNDTMLGGAGNDTFVFAAGFGQDVINGFDANPTGGQDMLDVSSYAAIDALTFNSHVSIQVVAGNTVITIDGTDSITLNGVSAAGAVTAADFLLHL